ncbi:MAG TPA: MFS transporter [Thermoanaerobaculia bacterium]|nr:MFS transporter [Thermoanaerobaculia bacterium]
MTTQAPHTEAARLAALMIAAFVDTLGAFLVLALLPFYAQELGASALEVGALVAAFAVAQTASVPFWGRASDRFGRRPVILLGLVIASGGYLAFAFASSLEALLLSRLAQGLGGGTVAAVFAYVADVVPAQHRAERLGWLTAATSAAAMVGPLLGSFATRYDPSLPGLVVAGLGVIAVALAWWLLPEPIRPPQTSATERPSLFVALLHVLTRPAAAAHRLVWIYTLAMAATQGTLGIAGLYLERRFGATEETIWPFFTCLALVSLLVRVVVLGPFVRRAGELPVLRVGAFFLACGLLLLPIPDRALWILVPISLIAAGTSFLYPCLTALVTRAVPDARETGQALGVQQAFGGCARIAGPILAGGLFERVAPEAPFLAAAVLMAAVTALAVFGLGAGPRRAVVG